MRTIKYIGLLITILGLLTAIIAMVTEGIKLYRELPTATPHQSDATPSSSIAPTQTPNLIATQTPWILANSIVTKENLIESQNTSNNWQALILSSNLKFSSAFEIKLNMESIGSNGIVLTHTQNEGVPWWQGTKRMGIFCEEGTLGVSLLDGSAEKEIYDNDVNRPSMPTNNGTTICQITIKFDQYAKNIQIIQDNKVIFIVTPEQVGNFQGGLFPDGNILKVELSSSPKSESKISSVKLIELNFYVPPQ